MRIKKWLMSMFLGMALFTCHLVTATPIEKIDKIIVFGDSLSDNGNVYNMLAAAKKVIPLVPLIPKTPPYFEGHFTNGHVWIEHLATTLNIPLVNYAYGGSWAEGFYDSFQILPPSLSLQVDMYSIAPSTIVDFSIHKHLYVIWSGNNDYLRGRDNIEYATTNTVDAIALQIDWLKSMGAKNFLVLNIPDLSRTPIVAAKGYDFAIRVQKIVTKHNEKLAKKIDEMRTKNPTLNLFYVDIAAGFDDLILNPDKYHFKNITQACYNGGYMFAARNLQDDPEVQAAKEAKFEIINNPVLMNAYTNSIAATRGYPSCPNPDEFLFWDQIHPSRVAHQFIGLGVYSKLSEDGILSKLALK